MSEEADDLRALLSTPRARVAYDLLKREAWIAAFDDVDDPVLLRLRAVLIIQELHDRLDPERAEALACAVAIDDGLMSAPRRGRPDGWKKPDTEKRRGTCAVCDADVSMKGDGTARKHPCALMSGEACRGSGKPVR